MKRDDTLWKAILEDIFDDFLRFFFADADRLFDLDKEPRIINLKKRLT